MHRIMYREESKFKTNVFFIHVTEMVKEHCSFFVFTVFQDPRKWHILLRTIYIIGIKVLLFKLRLIQSLFYSSGIVSSILICTFLGRKA